MPIIPHGHIFSHRRGWDELWEALIPGCCMEDVAFEMAQSWVVPNSQVATNWNLDPKGQSDFLSHCSSATALAQATRVKPGSQFLNLTF